MSIFGAFCILIPFAHQGQILHESKLTMCSFQLNSRFICVLCFFLSPNMILKLSWNLLPSLDILNGYTDKMYTVVRCADFLFTICMYMLEIIPLKQHVAFWQLMPIWVTFNFLYNDMQIDGVMRIHMNDMTIWPTFKFKVTYISV